MNIILRSAISIARACIGNSTKGVPSLASTCTSSNSQAGSLLSTTKLNLVSMLQGLQQTRTGTTLTQAHKKGPYIKPKRKKNPFDGAPFMKGVVIKTLIRKPKKPNSGNRKCVLVRLSSGKEMVSYVPGIGHNLQEHNVVLCRVGRLRDTPGVKIKCVRGKYDLPQVIKPTQ